MKASHEMQMNGNGQSHARNGARARAQRVEEEAGRSGSWLGSLVMFLLGLGVAGAGLAISLIWIYTEGKLDSKSVSAALPVIQADVEDYLMIVGKNTIKMYEKAEKLSRPYLEGAIKGGQAAWQEGGKQLRDGARWAEDNYGDLASTVWEEVRVFRHVTSISDIFIIFRSNAYFKVCGSRWCGRGGRSCPTSRRPGRPQNLTFIS